MIAKPSGRQRAAVVREEAGVRTGAARPTTASPPNQTIAPSTITLREPDSPRELVSEQGDRGDERADAGPQRTAAVGAVDDGEDHPRQQCGVGLVAHREPPEHGPTFRDPNGTPVVIGIREAMNRHRVIRRPDRNGSAAQVENRSRECEPGGARNRVS